MCTTKINLLKIKTKRKKQINLTCLLVKEKQTRDKVKKVNLKFWKKPFPTVGWKEIPP